MVSGILNCLGLIRFSGHCLSALSKKRLRQTTVTVVLIRSARCVLLSRPLGGLSLGRDVIAVRAVQGLTSRLNGAVLIIVRSIGFTSIFSSGVVTVGGKGIFQDNAIRRIVQARILRRLCRIPLRIVAATSKGGRYACRTVWREKR